MSSAETSSVDKLTNKWVNANFKICKFMVDNELCADSITLRITGEEIGEANGDIGDETGVSSWLKTLGVEVGDETGEL